MNRREIERQILDELKKQTEILLKILEIMPHNTVISVKNGVFSRKIAKKSTENLKNIDYNLL